MNRSDIQEFMLYDSYQWTSSTKKIEKNRENGVVLFRIPKFIDEEKNIIRNFKSNRIKTNPYLLAFTYKLVIIPMASRGHIMDIL
jgi:hypothetical protein